MTEQTNLLNLTHKALNVSEALAASALLDEEDQAQA